MNILFCTPTFERLTHGPSKFANLLLQINLQFPSHQIDILTENAPNSNHPNITHFDLPKFHFLFKFGKLKSSWIYYRQILKLLKFKTYDIIVINDACYSFVSNLLLSQPIVSFLNDEDYLSIPTERFKLNRDYLNRLFHYHLEKWTLKGADAVVTNSNYLRTLALDSYGLSEHRVYKMYKSIDLTLWPFRERLPLQHKRATILFVKTNFSVGGLRNLIKAMSYCPSILFNLWLVGPKLQFQSKIQSWVLPYSNIKMSYFGPQSPSSVLKLMHEASVLCIPSVREGLGVANIEGLAAGIPVVSTRVGGIVEVLDHGKNGWLANHNDPEDLALTIQKCLDAPQLRIAKSKAGRKYVEKHFQVTKMLNRFIEIMEKVASNEYNDH